MRKSRYPADFKFTKEDTRDNLLVAGVATVAMLSGVGVTFMGASLFGLALSARAFLTVSAFVGVLGVLVFASVWSLVDKLTPDNTHTGMSDG